MGATITVRAGDNLQTAIERGAAGRHASLLQAGATFTGNFVLPVKTGAPSSRSAPRPSPARRMQQPGSPRPRAVARQDPSAEHHARTRDGPGQHHWRLMLLEFPRHAPRPTARSFRSGTGRGRRTRFRWFRTIRARSPLHPRRPAIGQKRGIALNAAAVTIRNCYISDIKAVGARHPGDRRLERPRALSHREQLSRSVWRDLLLGGADPGIPNLVATGVVVRRNHFTARCRWRDPIVADSDRRDASRSRVARSRPAPTPTRSSPAMPSAAGSVARVHRPRRA